MATSYAVCDELGAPVSSDVGISGCFGVSNFVELFDQMVRAIGSHYTMKMTKSSWYIDANLHIVQ